MLMPASPHNPITHASIKAAILYNFFTQNPKMWRNFPNAMQDSAEACI